MFDDLIDGCVIIKLILNPVKLIMNSYILIISLAAKVAYESGASHRCLYSSECVIWRIEKVTKMVPKTSK